MQELLTNDAHETAACFERWPHQYVQLSRGPYVGRVQRLALPAIEIVREQVNRRIEQRGTCPPGTYAFSAFSSAGCRARYPDAEFHFGDAQLHDDRYERRLISDENADAITITIESRHLDATEQTCESMSSRTSLCSSGYAVLQVAARAQEVLALARSHPQLTHDPRWAENVSRELTDAIREAFEAARSMGAGRGPRRSRSQLVDRARSAIAEDGYDDSVGGISRRLGVSRRTLQYAFEAELDMSPTAYLRAQRLNRCRTDLLAAENGAAVVDIAMRWGFWHPGRFARYYRDMFGEAPAQTRLRATRNSTSR